MMNSIYICFRWKWMPCGETKAQTIMTISFHSCFNIYLFFVSYFAGLYFGVMLWNFFQIRFFFILFFLFIFIIFNDWNVCLTYLHFVFCLFQWEIFLSLSSEEFLVSLGNFSSLNLELNLGCSHSHIRLVYKSIDSFVIAIVDDVVSYFPKSKTGIFDWFFKKTFQTFTTWMDNHMNT